MKRILFLALLAVFLAIPFQAWAAPAVTLVTGTLTDGQTITITGTGFGAHVDYDVKGTNYLCSWVDDFDGYADLTALDVSYNWSTQNFTLATDTFRGTKAIKKTASTGSSKLRPASNTFNTGGVWYFSFWFKLNATFDQSATTTPVEQWKIVRLFTGTSQTQPDFYPGLKADEGPDGLGHHSDDDCGNDGCVGETGTFFSVLGTVQGAAFRDAWHRLEVYSDVANDELFYTVDGHQWYDGNAVHGAALFPADWAGASILRFSIDEVHSSSSDDYGWIDDVYADNTWARVEVSQTDAFAVDTSAKLNKTLCPPRTWSTTQVTCDLDLEGITLPAYLFVVDSAGAVSASYTLSSGAECAVNGDCNDSNECTDDTCVATVCVFTPDDTNTCTADSNPCTDTTCVSGTCTHTNDDTNPCDDSLYCTGAETCSAGTCNHAGDPCTACDTCNEGTNACDITLDTDADGYISDACSGGDDCNDSAAAINPGALEGPSTQGTCTDTVDNDCDGTIDAADTGCRAAGNCNDAGDCDDSDICTTDTCEGDPLACVSANNTAACATDGDPCTDDVCASDVCTHVPNTDPCNDGAWCTEDDVCAAGTCGGTPGVCGPGYICAESADACLDVLKLGNPKRSGARRRR